MFVSTNGSQIPWKVSKYLLSFFAETERTNEYIHTYFMNVANT